MADADRASVLVKAGLDVNAAAIDGTMPPHMAALLGNLAAADALIAEGAKVNAKLPSSGDAPLLVVVAAGIGNADATKDGFDHAWRDGFFVKGQGRRFGSRAERLLRHRPASGGRREPRAGIGQGRRRRHGP